MIKMIMRTSWINLIVALGLIFLGEQSHAQTRYLDPLFNSVQVEQDVLYGVNATVLYYSVIGEAVPEPLVMDVYSPNGDTETQRPLIIYLHNGNFLPSNYSTGGTKRDSSAVEICTRFAKMGYVVASCDYRLGWNPIAETQTERTNTLINAIYRGVQDCRTAVRYFRKSHAENGNPYGIDPSRISVIGDGQGGGCIALANGTMDSYNDVVLPKFTHEVQTPNGPFTLPMVLESVNGNVDGTAYGTTLGFVAPGTEDTLCYPNHVGYSSEVSATINLCGALADSSWLDSGDGPFISFQTPTDPYMPYGDGMVIIPGFNLNVVEMSGSLTVQQFASQFGNNAVFEQITGTNDPFPTYTAAAALHNQGNIGLFPFVRPATQPSDSSPWNWWALTDESSANSLQANPDMSSFKGRVFCDTIVKFTAPRLYLALQNVSGAGPGGGWIISGCTDANACNYNPNAQQNNGSCKYVGATCNDGSANTINDAINAQCYCAGIPIVAFGCTNPEACNYNVAALQDNGSCRFVGNACNDNLIATINDVITEACVCSGSVTDLNGNNENTYQGVFYQAVARNANGAAMANQNVNVRFTLRQGSANGSVEYQETQLLATNAQGLFSTTFGQGQAQSGSYAQIQWGINSKFLQVEFESSGWQTIGTQQLMAVPYAIRAKQVEPSGIKYQSPNGSCFILQVNDSGQISSVSVPCD
jgi:hypothetical protein